MECVWRAARVVAMRVKAPGSERERERERETDEAAAERGRRGEKVRSE